MKRVLQPELLDELPASDPRAIHSRRDLRRINATMGNARILTHFLAQHVGQGPITMAELGAGDGNVGLQVARNLGACGRILLIDREPAIAEAKLDGWKVEVIRADVFEWLRAAPNVDIIVVNLFLHHFETEALRRLLAESARRCRYFAAAEPRRNRFAQSFAAMVGLIGCNEVTRQDAVVSVRAGFNNDELARLWPEGSWHIHERRAGPFTHLFAAAQK